MPVLNPLLIVIFLPISILYVKAFSGYISDVFVGKLTKASFEIDIPNIFDIWVGYSIGMIVFIFMVLRMEFYGKFSVDIDQVLFIGFFSLYIGRIITQQKGVYFGKIHFSILFILSTVFFTIVCASIIFSDFSSFSLSGLSNLFHGIQTAYLDGLRETLDFIKSFITLYFLGPVILASVGEYFLYRQQSKKVRSIVAVSEQLPSDFKSITGREGIAKKLNQLFNNSSRIINVRCVTKSCTMPYEIRGLIENEYARMHEDILANRVKPCYRILRSPERYVFRDYYTRIINMKVSMDMLRDKTRLMQEYKNDYDKKLKSLLELKEQKLVDEKSYYFGQMRFIILDYENGDRKMLMIVKDTSIRKSRVGLFTEEPYIINVFQSMFDSIWDTVEVS